MSPRKLTLSQILFFLIKFVFIYLSLLVVGTIAVVPIAKAAQAPEIAPRLVIEAGGHTAVINGLIFTADGRELVSISDDKTIRVWSVSTDGRKAGLARTIRGQVEDGRAGEVFAAALSPPGASSGSPCGRISSGAFRGPRCHPLK
jgi:hypothetical protein